MHLCYNECDRVHKKTRQGKCFCGNGFYLVGAEEWRKATLRALSAGGMLAMTIDKEGTMAKTSRRMQLLIVLKLQLNRM